MRTTQMRVYFKSMAIITSVGVILLGPGVGAETARAQVVIDFEDQGPAGSVAEPVTRDGVTVSFDNLQVAEGGVNEGGFGGNLPEGGSCINTVTSTQTHLLSGKFLTALGFDNAQVRPSGFTRTIYFDQPVSGVEMSLGDVDYGSEGLLVALYDANGGALEEQFIPLPDFAGGDCQARRLVFDAEGVSSIELVTNDAIGIDNLTFGEGPPDSGGPPDGGGAIQVVIDFEDQGPAGSVAETVTAEGVTVSFDNLQVAEEGLREGGFGGALPEGGSCANSVTSSQAYLFSGKSLTALGFRTAQARPSGFTRLIYFDPPVSGVEMSLADVDFGTEGLSVILYDADGVALEDQFIPLPDFANGDCKARRLVFEAEGVSTIELVTNDAIGIDNLTFDAGPSDSDGDGVPDDEDLCGFDTDLDGSIPTTSLHPGHMGDDEVLAGCNASDLLQCVSGQAKGHIKHGLSPGLQSAFLNLTGIFKDGDGNGIPDCLE